MDWDSEMKAYSRLVITILLSATLQLGSHPPAISAELSDKIIIADKTKDTFPQRYFSGILAVGDVNGDGNDDILASALSNQKGYPKKVYAAKPFLLIFNPQKQRYELDEQFNNIVPEMIWPRRAVIEDLNKDGHADIFIVGTGTDGLKIIRCGEQNTLLLGGKSGFRNSTNKLPSKSDYSHGMILDDFDKDGSNDILIINSPLLNKDQCPDEIPTTHASYLLTNLSGEVKQAPLKTDGTSLNFSEANNILIHHGVSGNLNNDGYPDLVVGGDNFVEILETNDEGRYITAAKFSPPEPFLAMIKQNACLKSKVGGCLLPYTDFVVKDLDQDGINEVIASLANQDRSGTWQGQYFQVFKKVSGSWSDITAGVFPVQNKYQYPTPGKSAEIWCIQMKWVDIDGDGQEDIVCSTYNAYGKPDPSIEQIWIKRGSGFVSLKSLGDLKSTIGSDGSEFFSQRMGHLYPVKINGTMHIIGLKRYWEYQSEGLSAIQIFSWKIP